MTAMTEGTGRSSAGRAGLVRADDGQTLITGPVAAVLLAGGEATGGAASFVIHPLAPRALGSPVHTHRNEDEWSYVLEGEVGVELGGDTFVARPGDLVLKPRGVPHAFWNAGDEPARLLEVITPSGFEHYFTRLGEVLVPGALPDEQLLAQIAADHRLELDLASVPRLAQAHGLRLE